MHDLSFKIFQVGLGVETCLKTFYGDEIPTSPSCTHLIQFMADYSEKCAGFGTYDKKKVVLNY